MIAAVALSLGLATPAAASTPWGACGTYTAEGKEVTKYVANPRTYYLRCGTAAYGYRHILHRHRGDFERLAAGTFQDWRDIADLSMESITRDPDAANPAGGSQSCLSRVIFLKNIRTNQSYGSRSSGCTTCALGQHRHGLSRRHAVPVTTTTRGASMLDQHDHRQVILDALDAERIPFVPVDHGGYVPAEAARERFVHVPVLTMPAELLDEYVRSTTEPHADPAEALDNAVGMAVLSVVETLTTDHGDARNATVALGFRRDRSSSVAFFAEQGEAAAGSGDLGDDPVGWTAQRPD